MTHYICYVRDLNREEKFVSILFIIDVKLEN